MNKQRFRADFEDALKVMWAFNDVVCAGDAKRRESCLSYGKGRTKNALVYINAAIHTEETWQAIKELFPAEAASLYLSEQFSAAVMSHLFTLPEFLPDEEADLRERIYRLLGYKIGPDGLYLEPSEADLQARLKQMIQDPVADAEVGRWIEIQACISREGFAYWEEAKAFNLF